MTELRQPGLLFLVLGLALGILGDVTLRVFPWGLGATLLAVGLIVAVAFLQRRHHTRAGSLRVVYTLVALALAVGFVWRDAVPLKLLDVLALIVILGLLASERTDLDGGPSLGSFALRVSGTAAHTWLGPPLLVVHDVDWSKLSLGPFLGRLLGVARGLVVTLPIVLVFTALLAKADPVFALRLGELFDVDILALIGHVTGVLVYGWIAAGYLRSAVLREHPAHRLPPRLAWLTLGRTEIAVVLGSLDLLFASFVWIQLRYLFGGAEWVQKVAGLTYSEYARRGFFELVTVAALVLPLLLVAHWLLKPEKVAEARMFLALAGVQVVLVLVMLASALERMRLYRAEYGLTEQRFYTTAFMAWLGVLLVWFLLTVPRGRRDVFAGGVVVSALVALFLLHAVDPEDRIVRANTTLARAFDVTYALGLGADAAPALVEAARSLDPLRQGALARGLLKRWSDAPEADWRTTNLSRVRARAVIGDAEAELRVMAQAAGPAPVTP